MGAGVKHYLPSTNEIPPLLLLPYLHDQVEQVLGLLQPLGIRFLVQRSVMSSFLAIMQKTEPAVVRPLRVLACGPNRGSSPRRVHSRVSRPAIPK